MKLYLGGPEHLAALRHGVLKFVCACVLVFSEVRLLDSTIEAVPPACSTTYQALPDHGDDGAGAHVLDQPGEEGALGQVAVCGVQGMGWGGASVQCTSVVWSTWLYWRMEEAGVA